MAVNKTLPFEVVGIDVSTNYQPTMLTDKAINNLVVIHNTVNTRGTDSGVYNSPAGVLEHYTTEDPEYKIAVAYFAQVPRPKNIKIKTVTGLVYPPAA